MNFLNVFEDRVGSVFGDGPQGYTAPFSFKKLAKKAAHEMENETFVIDGVDTAPALYTILVSSDDDMSMRPLYSQLTRETSQFIEAQAQGRGYSFVGSPLVRFMVDPSLKSGKFSVFAENVDVRTLNRLRDEESKFMGTAKGDTGGMGGAAAPMAAGSHGSRFHKPFSEKPLPVQEMPVITPTAAPAPGGTDAGLDVMPQDVVLDAYEQAAQQQYAPQAQPVAAEPQPVAYPEPAVPTPAPRPRAAHAASPMTPPTQRRESANVPLVNPYGAQAAAGAGAAVAAAGSAAASSPAATCMLIDRQSGRTFTATAPRTIIGRERSQGGIVLRDPNISRRHAELAYDGRSWHITDLNSTNGTLVNNVDVDDCILRDGDLVTLGLINLEFREG
ncbi:MAG: DUF3662 and FHA domain-containing protein [Atopobiaceae bacterium]|nr:DUF3662 and FHA domain-containing protein [Atopobiaceae bacterium]MCI2173699.1 DUF3662 and FHA domain-containing protein [Atopobiaceae bacterium]MCI2207659.1 DUF3662 and FHA domain-containing protein [Atopobiaceae bacterium]